VSEVPRAETLDRLFIANLFGEGVDFDRFAWRFFREGVEIARLYGEGASGPSAALLRYAPGAKVPVHVHHGMEHILVLAGSQADADATYEAGSMLIHGPGTSHDVFSEQGCVVLAIWEKPVEILGEPAQKSK
jgi:anti-sigma factor ChrR (cupin superfamily)